MSAFSDTLKTWRQRRRFSQLALAMEAEVSARHLSFLETGRARPSREMVERLGAALELPLAARNQMLTQAGFAARYPGRSLEDGQMAPVRAALDHMLKGHEPFPGYAFDRQWRLLRMNRAAERLFSPLGVEEGADLLALLRSEKMAQVIDNWPEVARHLAQRLRTESAAQGGLPGFEEAANELSEAHGSPESANGPVIPTVYRLGPTKLALFSVIAQFGTPEDVTLDDLKIELFFPADSAAEMLLRKLAQEG